MPKHFHIIHGHETFANESISDVLNYFIKVNLEERREFRIECRPRHSGGWILTAMWLTEET